jgi:hypothetical protein
LLSFGVNLRVQGLLSVDALVFAQKFTLITSLSEFISVFKQPTPSVVFRDIIYRHLEFSSSSRNFQVMSSSSSSSNVNVPSASRGSSGPSRGVAPSAIFPNVITGPGSPPGNQPPLVNTIVQAFSKQRTAKEKKNQKAELLADTRRCIVSFLAAPTAFHDPLRTLSVEQLSELTDTELMENALMVFTTDNVDGSLRLADGSSISMFQCINEFASHSTTREGAVIKRRLKEKLSTLRAIADVERYTAVHEDDEIDPFLDDNISEDGFLDFSQN